MPFGPDKLKSTSKVKENRQHNQKHVRKETKNTQKWGKLLFYMCKKQQQVQSQTQKSLQSGPSHIYVSGDSEMDTYNDVSEMDGKDLRCICKKFTPPNKNKMILEFTKLCNAITHLAYTGCIWNIALIKLQLGKEQFSILFTVKSKT